MMPSTEVNTHVIIFFDGSRKYIPTAIADRMFAADSEIKNVTFNGSLINLASISKILSLEEFYEQYPKEQPDKPLPTLSDILAEKDAYIPTDPIRLAKKPTHIQSLMRGFKRSVKAQGHPINEQQQLLLDKMEKAYVKSEGKEKIEDDLLTQAHVIFGE